MYGTVLQLYVNNIVNNYEKELKNNVKKHK